MDKVVKNPIVISRDDLNRIQAQIAISEELLKFCPDPKWIEEDTRRRIAEGIVEEMMKNNLIRIEESEGIFGKTYSAKVVVYDEKSEK